MRGFSVLGITLLFEERTTTQKTELASLTSKQKTYIKMHEENANRITNHHHRQHTL